MDVLIADCGHPLCELIEGSCSLATGRSRGCTPGMGPRTVAPEIFDEIRALLPKIEERDQAAARRLADLIRREARDDRNVITHARDEEPELAAALERLCLRRT